MAERERRGLPRVDVARATGIFIHHLSALEHGNFEDLPDGPTVAGYVRAYADFLDLDAAGLVKAFCDERGIEEPVEPATAGARSVGSLVRVLLLAAAALAVVGIVWWGLRGKPVPASPPPVPEPVPAPAVAEEPRVEPAPPPAERPRPSSTLSVPEHAVGTEVVDRRLVGVSERFPAGTRVWFWTRVLGGRPGQRIRHVWIRDGMVIDTITLTLGGRHWRTYSFKTVYPGSSGRWAVEARDENGVVLARSEFSCGP